MKHFDIIQWTDFVRGTATPENQTQMQRHVGTGCRRCVKTVAALERVIRQVAKDPEQAPPDYAVRSVKAFFSLNRARTATLAERLTLNLNFDSALQPAAAGVRSAADEHPRLLGFDSDGYELALQVDPSVDGADVSVMGSIEHRTDGALASTPAFLIAADQIVASSLTDEIGGFELATRSGQATELWVLPKGRRPIVANLTL